MTLKEFLTKNTLKISDLARAIPVKHCVALRWVNGTAIPSRKNMARIIEYTKGEVTPSDFYEKVGNQ